MRKGITSTVSASGRRHLQAIVSGPKSPQKHVRRACIVLLSGEGLLRGPSRPPGKAPVAPEFVAEIIHLTQAPPSQEATHWTLRAMVKAVGIAALAVQDIWKGHGISPHRWRHFKPSNDPAFAEKLTTIVGLYVDCQSASPCRGAVGRREVANPDA